MADKPKKEIHVDLLAIDMEEGHWLKPKPENKLDPEKVEAIRKKHRDKYLAEQKAKKKSD